MLWFDELTSRKKISKIFYIYSATFPEEERRNKEQFLNLSENSNVYILSIKQDETAVGYCILWELNEFYFLEHFEIFNAFRNQQLGSKTLKSLTEKYEKIILETEPKDSSDTAARRIDFYKRNGFHTIEPQYIQPSYGDGKPSVNLWLMGNFSPENLEKTIVEIYNIVYAF